MAAMFITKPAICNLSSAVPQRSNYVLPSLKVSRVSFTSSTNYPKRTKLYTSSNDASIGDKAAEAIKDLEGKAKEVGDVVSEKTAEAQDKAAKLGEDAKANLEGLHEKNVETAGSMNEKNKEYAQEAKEAIEKSLESGAETAKNIGDNAQKNLQDAWDSTKDATQKIKDSVERKAEA